CAAPIELLYGPFGGLPRTRRGADFNRPEAARIPRTRRDPGFGGSSNGRTADSDSACLGSNPSPPATHPRTMTVAELKRLDIETVACVLQCSGNGRGFFDHKPSGTPWTVGAAGCVLWTGVPVRAVVEALGGVVAGGQFMTGTGGEPIPE